MAMILRSVMFPSIGATDEHGSTRIFIFSDLSVFICVHPWLTLVGCREGVGGRGFSGLAGNLLKTRRI
jgi:hypothetical protein